ncbi:MATE family efflux transporter [Vibrio europaeus]|uniref:Multidrug resistance protein NorM n=1 Tax=Vibrio europaeus TaxID=300876 RepID=A0A178JEF5_9VIBR|nr:MATE family efflux transporter [Vibrio europaeus]MDC5707299.1 MATE family efflux transporter [Vibrio europaeus]MDC5712664.1 MATE family efflux transporter [Vibrio europaeus]MDC5717307.1 MATE family efflux transporter [Vibrio europaeus]MDC5721159.1 MATE family efflux transporter [Vibrio europaeus]MDC5726607.1 MATE family efflux transporter [Vibrio europaeus]
MTTLSQVLTHTRGDFIRRLIAIALPITLQSIMFSSRSLVDVLMLGQLGEAEIAAVGVAARATFVTTIMLVGVTTGGALLTAQYWGASDRKGVRESTALTWLVCMVFAAITALLFILFPTQVMGLATNDPEVIQLGAEYLVITSVSMFAVACVASMAVGLRAMHKPGLSTFFSGIGILSNIFLNWVFIFGKLGVPAMGIKGAAIATVLSGAIEVATLFGYLYAKKHLLAFSANDLRHVLEWTRVIKFLKLSLPTTFNFLAWAGGLFAYHAIMGQSGVQGLAALSVMSPVESIALALLIGMSNAAAVLVGNQIGAKKYDEVYYQAIGVTILSVLVGVVVAVVLYLVQGMVLDAFSALTPETRALSEKFMLVMSVGIILRSLPMMTIVGVLRAGGDVKFCLYQDLVAQWLIGIPLAAYAAIGLGWKPEWIYLLFLTEEVIKWFASLYRMQTRKWIRNLIEN